MADPTNPDAPDTQTQSDPTQTAPDPNATNQAILGALGAITSRLEALEKSGATRAEAVAQTAEQIGWKPEDLVRIVDEANAAGRPGEGVIRATGLLLSTMQAQANEREGKRELQALASHKTLGEAYDKHGEAFQQFLVRERLQIASLAEPGAAAKAFKYFLSNHTDWDAKQEEKRINAARAEERAKVEQDLKVRRPIAVTPSLTPGAKPEGGALRSLVNSAVGASEEPTERQIEIMSNLGLDEEKMKKAMKSQAQKTAFGVPLDFVPTRNEGAV